MSAGRSGIRHLGFVLALFGLLLRLGAPGIPAPMATVPTADLQRLLGVVIEICSPAGSASSASGDSSVPPQSQHAHDCTACCSLTSLAALPPPAAAVPLQASHAVATHAYAPASRPLSIYAVRQRGPPSPGPRDA